MANNKILLFTDNPMHPSGVAAQAKHICYQLLKDGYEVFVLAVETSPKDKLTKPTIYKTDVGDIKVISTNSFQDLPTLFTVIEKEKPSCLVLFQDPHQYSQVFRHASLIRQKCPMLFVTVWDTYLIGDGKAHWNQPLYQSVDHISCISKQTGWFVNNVLSSNNNYSKTNPTVSYCGHGRDPQVFKPLKLEEYAEVKKTLYNNKEYDFVALMVNRNQSRKKIADLIEAWRLFNDSLPKEKAEKTCLVLHTEIVAQVGTNLREVALALAGDTNIIFSAQKYDEETINKLYNCADICINVSNAAGFELNVNEAMLCGKPCIINTTGGLWDQIGFFYGGLPVEWTPNNFKHSNTLQHGIWAYPLFGQRTIIGNPATPYLYDYNCSIDDIVSGLQYWYNQEPLTRLAAGLKGREYVIERGLNSNDFGRAVVRDIKSVITNFKPVQLFDIHKL